MVFEISEITFAEILLIILGRPISECFWHTAKSIDFFANLYIYFLLITIWTFSIMVIIIHFFLSPYFCPYKFLLVDA